MAKTIMLGNQAVAQGLFEAGCVPVLVFAELLVLSIITSLLFSVVSLKTTTSTLFFAIVVSQPAI